MNNFVSNLWSGFSKAYAGYETWLASLFEFTGRPLPIEQIIGQIDPRFVPQATMSGEQIDVSTRMEMSAHGYKHARLVTSETHPELYKHWSLLCQRAGFDRPMQLILCESDIPNAFAVSSNEMGFSTGLLKQLTYREVIAVLSHELGHANNTERYQSLHTGASAGFSLLGLTLPLIGKGGSGNFWIEARNRGIGAIAGSAVGQIAGNKLTGYVSELEADLEGAVISRDPAALASALTKLEGVKPEVSLWQKILHMVKSVHPATEERVRWLGEIEQELNAKAPAYQPVEPVVTGPAPRVAARDAEVERVSTNLPGTAISGA